MFPELLSRRVATWPTQPLFTHYDGESRVELSAVTFANWVDKTALLLEDQGVEPGDAVRLDVARTHPGHWVSLVWVAAVWQRGCHALVLDVGAAALKVSGPEGAAAGMPTVVCSLHPLGLPLPSVPAGCLDYAEVLAQPDVHTQEPLEPGTLAFDAVTHEQVAAVAPSGQRRLLMDPTPGWGTVADALVAPVLGGGSTVLATGCDAARLEQISAEEKLG